MIAAQSQTVADAFALGQVCVFGHAADGMMARIWRLDTTSGSYAVKEHRYVPDADDLHMRLEASARLAYAVGEAGSNTPRIIRNSTGTLALRLRGGADDGAYVSVAEWIDGRPCELRRDAMTAAEWLGETVATIELVPDPPGAPALDPWLAGWLTKAPTEAQWHAVLDEARRSGRPWAGLLESRITQLVNLGSIVGSPSDDLGVLHTDLQAKNVLVTRTGFALLDWDDAALCSRDHILARTLVEWLTSGGVHADAIMRFMGAYRSRGGSGRLDDLTDFGYAAAAFLNYAPEMGTV